MRLLLFLLITMASVINAQYIVDGVQHPDPKNRTKLRCRIAVSKKHPVESDGSIYEIKTFNDPRESFKVTVVCDTTLLAPNPSEFRARWYIDDPSNVIEEVTNFETFQLDTTKLESLSRRFNKKLDSDWVIGVSVSDRRRNESQTRTAEVSTHVLVNLR